MDSSGENVEYSTPKREILTMGDMNKWHQSEGYHEFVGFVSAMNEAVKGTTLTGEYHNSAINKNLLSMLEKLDSWVDEIAPIEQPQRFGNKAFKTWYERLKEGAEALLKEYLPEEFHSAVVELAVYLTESFGNSTRIDYGTGHEMSFAMFLCCLFKIRALQPEDAKTAISKVFETYLVLMRKLQLKYRMEPAGSHGVWSLDDYQFLPFVWGSAQLIGHPKLDPSCFPNEETYSKYSKEYMFMGCIQFISKVKTGPFAEHSNKLWNVSGVPSWSKVNTGLIKMYKAEVLGKFPVIQHVLFGNILPIKPHLDEKKT